MKKILFDKEYGGKVHMVATYEREDFYYLPGETPSDHIMIERKTEKENHMVVLTFEELEKIYLETKKVRSITKWVVYARDRGGDPHNDERARIVDEAIEKCLEELGIKNGSFEAIELTETFLDYFEEWQG